MKNQSNFAIPSGYVLLARTKNFGFEIYGTLYPHVMAVCFDCESGGEVWHYRFRDDDHMHGRIKKTISEYQQSKV
jgi:hypothetical protein